MLNGIHLLTFKLLNWYHHRWCCRFFQLCLFLTHHLLHRFTSCWSQVLSNHLSFCILLRLLQYCLHSLTPWTRINIILCLLRKFMGNRRPCPKMMFRFIQELVCKLNRVHLSLFCVLVELFVEWVRGSLGQVRGSSSLG